MKHPVRLDEKTHTYYVPGPSQSEGEVRVPGFSEIAKDLGVIQENKFHTVAGRVNGTAVHLFLQFCVRGGNPASPDPRIAEKVEAIRKFVRDTGFKIVDGETPLFDPGTGTCCTPDLYGYIGNWAWVIDAKNGARLPYHAIQTACQKLALNSNGFRAQKRGALYLKKNYYRLEEHTDPDDMTKWKHYARQYHLKHKEIA